MITYHKTYSLFNRVIFERARITPPFSLANPLDNEACFFHILSGPTEYFSETQCIKLGANQSVLLKCGNYLMRMFSEDTKEFEFVAVHFYPDVLKKIYEKDLPSFLNNQTGKTSSGSVSMAEAKGLIIPKYIEGLLFYFDNPGVVSEEILVLKVKELILLLMQTNEAPKIGEILSSLFTPASFSFKEVIDAHLLSALTVEELAKFTNLSVSSFKREFAKIYHDTPANYLREHRLEHARNLLLLSDQRISDIGYECGFQDVAHFSTAFKERFGVSPSQFRVNQKPNSLN